MYTFPEKNKVIHCLRFHMAQVEDEFVYYTVFCKCNWKDPTGIHWYTIEGAIQHYTNEHLLKDGLI